MKSRPVIRRALADRDVESIVDHYLGSAGAAVALRFIDALEDAVAHVSRHAGTGSPRYSLSLNIPGLRTWPLGRFPYLAFYFDRGEEIEIWRVLHGSADVPEWLTG